MSPEQAVFSDGANYERFMGRWSARVASTFLEWLAPPPGLRWLDVGCGNGAFTEQIVTRCAPKGVFGLDPSEGQIAYARSRHGVPNVDFQRGDAEALPFVDATFDIAAMALVISFVPNQARAVAEMRRVVRPGGCVGAYMWNLAEGGLPAQPIVEAMRVMGLTYPARGKAGLDHLSTLWRGASLQSVETRVIHISIDFLDVDDFWETNTAPGTPIGEAVSKLSPHDRERLRKQVQETLPKSADGTISFGAHANAIKGYVPA